jgi:hypothetical protein
MNLGKKRDITETSKMLKISMKPTLHSFQDALHATIQADRATCVLNLSLTEQQQTYPSGINGISDDVSQSANMLWHTNPDRHVKYFFGQFDSTFHL